MQAVPFLMEAGQSDTFEISSSQVALKKSRDPQVRRYATMMIDHHTGTTNQALAAAKAGGVTPPPPFLTAPYREMIAELNAAAPVDFDRIYLGQQVPSHRGALELQTAYAAQGDVPPLRATAKAAVPIVRQHLTDAERMMVRMR
ncbi:DUF4142 domain-containing protein [uncultured Sphingomonas sp.]|uniref:DUF4142 domain-containing protein n=1 Tax=uncultured Sphingomonas sp. TaxID=158754 RepID=UPI0035CC9AFD